MTINTTKILLTAIALICSAMAVGCGDGSTPLHDSAIVSDAGSQPADGTVEPAPDLFPAPDLTGVEDMLPPDSQPAVDSSPTASSALAGKVSVSTTITCGVTPDLDCKGYLYVGVVDQPAAPPASKLLGSAIVDPADLSGGKQVAYQITGLPPNKIVYVAAMLAESPPQKKSATTPPFPKSGDLVTAPTSILLSTGSTVTKDVTLDARW